MMIPVAARGSPLSRVQTEEVLRALPSHITFEPYFVSSHGDIDLATSLRTLDKTDFFTREVDALVLNHTCRISIHSAKDLPDPIPKGLTIVAITCGIDPSDSLVMREYDTFETLPPKSVIATSSLRREEIVRSLRPDLLFRDLRGTIQARIELLQKNEADGVVVAEAALIRLNLTHLNRIRLPFETTPMQGQLAILARDDDTEMKELFHLIDSRHMPKALYLGPEFPLKAFPGRKITHCPIIETIPRISHDLGDWHSYTHLILTSKTAVTMLAALLRKANISPHTIGKKTVIAVGQATAEMVRAFGANPLIAREETAEGVVEVLNKISLDHAHFFWPHAALSRPIIENALKEKGACFTTCILYDTLPVANPPLPPLSDFQEILFSSPSTVSAFFSAIPKPPHHLQFTPIGRITHEALANHVS
jgi:hydroxymethylbilane synthase